MLTIAGDPGTTKTWVTLAFEASGRVYTLGVGITVVCSLSTFVRI